MDYLIEIKDGPESKPLLEYLSSLKNVKVTKVERKTYDVSDLVATIKKSERSKRIPWKDAKKQIAKWK